MKPEQITRLTELEQALVDVFVEEADPASWPAKAEAKEKAKRSAAASMQLVRGVQTILRAATGGNAAVDDVTNQRKGIAREAASLERAARAMLTKHGQQPH